MSSDIADRLRDTPRRFSCGLELGCAGGALSSELIAAGKAEQMVAADTAPAFLAAAAKRGLPIMAGDEASLPIEPGRFDLVISMLTLHWANDLPGALARIRMMLAPDGFFLGALFGAGTLRELRHALTQAETEIAGGISPRLSPLPGLKDLAELLQRGGFQLPVADRDTVTVTYRRLSDLLHDLKGMGETAAFLPGAGRPISRRILARTEAIYSENYAQLDGRLIATFEIIHAGGWSPGPGQPQPLPPGSGRASLAQAIKRSANRL